jgi:hypothetical protein
MCRSIIFRVADGPLRDIARTDHPDKKTDKDYLITSLSTSPNVS